MKRAANGRILLLLLVAGLVAAVFFSPLRDWLTLAGLKARQAELATYVEAHWLTAAAIFFLAYVAAAALSIPGAVILTLAAGAIFGLWPGLAIASFASSIGASLAFLGSRYLLRGWVERRFGRRLEAVDRGVEKDGIVYLLTLRLNPAVPFWLVNLGMGLTRLRLPTFYAVSQIGMLPGTFVYVNAGTQLGRLSSLRDAASLGLILSLALLSLFPSEVALVLSSYLPEFHRTFFQFPDLFKIFFALQEHIQREGRVVGFNLCKISNTNNPEAFC